LSARLALRVINLKALDTSLFFNLHIKDCTGRLAYFSSINEVNMSDFSLTGFEMALFLCIVFLILGTRSSGTSGLLYGNFGHILEAASAKFVLLH
jgi:hypothetical protein